MTNDNYTSMTNEELVQLIQKLNISTICLNRQLQKHHNKLYLEVLNRTSFLESSAFHNNTIPIQARIYVLVHNLTSHPICSHPECNNKVGWSRANLEFNHHCCNACSNKDPKTLNKYRETCQKQWGVDNAFQSEEKKEKIRQTNLKKFGVENPSQSEEIQKKKRYTTKSHFGVEYPFQSEDIKSKIHQTQQLKYGGCGLQSEYIKNKVKQTTINTYGVEYASQSDIVKEHYKQTCQQKWGVDNAFQSEEIKSKIKHHWQKHYGVDNPSQLDWVIRKILSNTKHRKYKNQKYPNVEFDSSWEFIVYDFLMENEIKFKYHVEPISYIFDGTQFLYYPDFQLDNGRLVEVKGDQFFRINESTGKEEMFCPYGRKKLGEEKWNWLCGKFEAKHQCMLKNNVVILRDDNIKNLTIELFK